MFKRNLLLILICYMFLITGCVSNSNDDKDYTNQNNNTERSDSEVSNIKVTINDESYILKLEDNKTVDEFLELLPQEFVMNELNGNEKYVYMDNSLITDSYNPNRIEKGDVMLFGNNCLVIFYKSFDTSYSYTKIGHIDNLDILEEGNITVRFEE